MKRKHGKYPKGLDWFSLSSLLTLPVSPCRSNARPYPEPCSPPDSVPLPTTPCIPSHTTLYLDSLYPVSSPSRPCITIHLPLCPSPPAPTLCPCPADAVALPTSTRFLLLNPFPLLPGTFLDPVTLPNLYLCSSDPRHAKGPLSLHTRPFYPTAPVPTHLTLSLSPPDPLPIII